jgi:TonB family protein
MSYSKPQIAAIGFIFFCSLRLGSLYAVAGEVKIVANPSIKTDSISAAELRAVFLAERNSLKDGSHVEPVFLRAGPTHETFLKEFLQQTNESLQSHYGSLVFTGKAFMPKSFNSDAEVLAYVAKTRGAIGYVGASTSTDGAKILAVTLERSHSDRVLLTQVQPEYPETLRQLHIGGTVRLQITISAQGRVESVTLLGGNPILGESAIKAVQLWIFAAAPSRTTQIVTLPFDSPR